MTSALTVTTIENEARVLDTDLALSLGMSTPTHIRQNLIAPNRAEFETFGVLAAAQRNHLTPSAWAAPRPPSTSTRSRRCWSACWPAPWRPEQVRAEVIRVFTAWRRGNLAPMVQAPTSIKDALLLALAGLENPVVIMPAAWDGRTVTI